jgi:hypothetical protein
MVRKCGKMPEKGILQQVFQNTQEGKCLLESQERDG